MFFASVFQRSFKWFLIIGAVCLPIAIISQNLTVQTIAVFGLYICEALFWVGLVSGILAMLVEDLTNSN